MPPILDSQRLAALGDDLGDAEFLRETVEIYVGEMPSRQTAMRNAHSVGDRSDMRDRAHSLGSASAMLGLMELESSCRLVELRATSADDTELSGLFDHWMNSSERALVAATVWLSTAQGSCGSRPAFACRADSSRVEPVADAAHRLDVPGRGGRFTDFPAQVGQMDIDDVVVAEPVVTPHPLQAVFVDRGPGAERRTARRAGRIRSWSVPRVSPSTKTSRADPSIFRLP